jgi:hypothetical protein
MLGQISQLATPNLKRLKPNVIGMMSSNEHIPVTTGVT